VHLASVKLTRQQHGVDDNGSMMRQCDLCREYAPGVAHRNAIYGYLHYNDLGFKEKDKGRSFLYWVFGGPTERHHPKFEIFDYAIKGKRKIAGVFQKLWASTIRGVVPRRKASEGSSP